MASKNKIDLSDFNYEEDDAHSPMGSLAKKAKSTRPDVRKSKEAPANEHPLLPSVSWAMEPVTPVSTSENTVEELASLKPLAEREQTVSNASPNTLAGREHNVSKPLAGARASNGRKSETVSNASPNTLAGREHNVSKPLAETDVLGLVGKERKLLFFIFQKCEAIGSLETQIITTEDLLICLDVSSVRLRNLIFRLQDGKKLIRVTKVHIGRSGWRQFALEKECFRVIRMHLSSSNSLAEREQTVSNASPKPLAYPLAEPSSSSRDLFIKEESTTTQTGDLISRIDLSLVKHLGVTTSVLSRCVELYPVLKPEQLEVLAYRFAEFAKDPKNKVQNARGFFISLAKQASEGQVPLDHIETPDERLMRLFVSRQVDAKTKRINFEQKALEFECEVWLDSLALEMKLTLIPETSLLKEGSAAHAAMLKSYFADNVWPERKKMILTATEATP